MISALLAAVFTFTATATGVEKGTPIEFFLAGAETDRDYETLFTIDTSIEDFCRGLDRAGFPRGKPADPSRCRLWPTGARISLDPPLERFLDFDWPSGVSPAQVILTGGTRGPQDRPIAATSMPAAVLALYSLAQSPLTFNGSYEQGVVYGAFKAKGNLKKGDKVVFSVSCDTNTIPRSLELVFSPETAKSNLQLLKDASEKGELDVLVGFSDDLTVEEAQAVSQALALVDSPKIKINGRRPGDFFYRAFLPLIKWKDRKERLTQPFEVHVGDQDRVCLVEEDWSGEGLDPKLTEKQIRYEDMKNHSQVETVFFFVQPSLTLGKLKKSLERIPASVFNHYVFVKEP